MNSTIIYRVGHARLADLHRQAERDALARAARQARRPASPAAARPAVLTRWAHRLGWASAS